MRKIISVILVIIIFVLCLPLNAFAATSTWGLLTASGFDSGTGTEENPYVILNAAQLSWFANSVNSGDSYAGKYIVLKNDIVLNNINSISSFDYIKDDWNLWTPIGTSDHPFSGTFDGNYHTIYGMVINTSTDNAGLFGVLTNASIYSVNIRNSLIIGNENVGSISGMMTSTETGIYHCTSDAWVFGRGHIGGLNGYSSCGYLSKSSFSGKVKGKTDCGGLCGSFSNSMAENCYNCGTISGTLAVAGLFGICMDSTVVNCFNVGQVDNKEKIGIAKALGTSVLKNCYNIDGGNSSSILSVEEILKMTSFHDYDFENVWYFDNEHNYPVLRNNKQNTDVCVPSDAKLFNGHYYQIILKQVSWTSAETACENMGGHLATITSQEEQNFIDSINNGNRLWIGGYRNNDLKKWYWVTGENWSYTNWGSGEPNNSDNVISDENRVSVWPSDWNDLNDRSTEQKGFICEWDTFSSSIENLSSQTNGINSYKVNTFTGDSIINITVRSADAILSNTIGNKSLSDKKLELKKLLNVTVNDNHICYDCSDGVISVNQKTVVGDLILKSNNHYDYIIPNEVIKDFAPNSQINSVFLNAYMRRVSNVDRPYVSTVFCKEEGEETNYTELQYADKFNVYAGKKYDFYISAANYDGELIYYISQDEDHKITSTTGHFKTEELATKLVPNQDTFVYVVSKYVKGSKELTEISEPVKINIKIDYSNEDAINFYKEKFSGGKISLSDGLKVTLPKDWFAVGGSEISLVDFNFPISCDVDVDGTVRLSVGFDWRDNKSVTTTTLPKGDYDSFDGTFYRYKEKKKTWDLLKSSIKGVSSSYKNAITEAEKKGIRKDLSKKLGINMDLATTGIDKTKGFNLSTLGYIEGKIVGDSFVVTDMEISVAGEFSMSYTQQFVGGYLGFDAKGKVEVSFNWSRGIADKTLALDFDVKATGTPELKASGGVGFDGVACAGVYGKAYMPMELDFTKKTFTISLQGSFGYESQFLIWKTGEKDLLNGTLGPAVINIGKKKLLKSSYPTKNSLENNNDDCYKLSDRVSTSTWLGDKKLLKSSTNNFKVDVLQKDIYKSAYPNFISVNGTTLAVWVADDAKRDSYNRLKLVYSIYDKGSNTWSTPQSVCDDGKNDAYPSLATDGENIYVVWQKINKVLSETECATYDALMSNSEIFIAKYDVALDEFVDVRQVTDNKVYDYSPVLVFKDGEPYVFYASTTKNVLWCEDSNSIICNTNGNNNVLVDGISSVINMSCALVNGVPQVAYSVDADGNLATCDDIKAFYGYSTFNEVELDSSVTSLEYVTINNDNMLIVSTRTNMYYVDVNGIEKVFKDDISVQNGISVSSDGKPVVLWMSTEGGINKLCMSQYTNNCWSKPICISDDCGEMFNLSFAAFDGYVTGVGTRNRVSDDNYFSDLISFKFNDFTDLSLERIDVDELNSQICSEAKVLCTVKNNGLSDVEGMSFVVTDSFGNEKTYSNDTLLRSGETESYVLPLYIPESFDAQSVTVDVVCDEKIDANKSDNKATLTFDKALLSSLETSASFIGDYYIIAVDVENFAFASAKNTKMKVLANSLDGNVIDEINLGEIGKTEKVSSEVFVEESELQFDDMGNAIVYFETTADNSEETVCAVFLKKHIEMSLNELTPVRNSGLTVSSDMLCGINGSIDNEDGMIVSTLISKFKNPSDNVIVKDSLGSVCLPDSIVGTGYTVSLVDELGAALDTLTIAVKGDVNGDGYVNNRDIIIMRQYVLSIMLDISNVQITAADLFEDGRLNNRDISYLMRVLVGKEKM